MASHPCWYANKIHELNRARSQQLPILLLQHVPSEVLQQKVRPPSFASCLSRLVHPTAVALPKYMQLGIFMYVCDEGRWFVYS